MRPFFFLAVGLALLGLAHPVAAETSWIFRPAEFSHDPQTSARVDQYAAAAPALVRVDETYQQSAYRHQESTIRVGGSADYLHVVETWGAGESLRPYGEWLYPFRAGATPYGPWGNAQGPWTLPFGSWVNPYGLGRLPNPPWAQGYILPMTPMPGAGPQVF